MEKKVVVLAVAGLISGGAMAQSNVVVYGSVDAYFGLAKSEKTTGNQRQSVVNAGGISGSRFGFRGEEGLGNGLKSVFVLEFGSLDITTDKGPDSARQTYVGLVSESLGAVHAGRIQGGAWSWAVKYDPFGAGNAFSNHGSITMGAKTLLQAGSTWGRLTNAVSYISPKFSGLTLRGDVALGEQVTDASGPAGFRRAQRYYALTADYDRGPLSIGLSLAQMRDRGGTTNIANDAGMRDWGLGARYDFSVVKPFLSYQQSKDMPATGAEVTSKIWNLGAQIPLGQKNTIRVGYVDFKNDAAASGRAKGYAVSLQHALSKRTTLYAGYRTVHNGDNSSFTVSNSSGVTTSKGMDASVFGLGMYHSF